MDETVCESGGSGPEAPVPLSGGQEADQVVCWVGLISQDCEGFSGEAGGVDVLQGGEGCLDDLPS